MRTRDPGGLRNRKQNGGAQSDSGVPLISPSVPSWRNHSPLRDRDEKAQKGRQNSPSPHSGSTSLHLQPAPRAAAAPSRPSRGARSTPLAPLQVAAASPRPPDAAGQHAGGRTGDRSDPPCPLRGGREVRRDSSIRASLTQTPPSAATATAATGRS